MSRQQTDIPPHPSPFPQGEGRQVKIIGAGLAGAACANAFVHAGYSVTVHEQSAAPAAGASGVPIALFAPSISADDAPHSRLLRRGVHLLLLELRRLTDAGLLVEGVDWAMTGVLERCIRADKKLPNVWLEPHDPIGLQSRVSSKSITARSAQQVLEIFHGAAGWVNPKRLIAAWLAHPSIEVKTEARVDDVAVLDSDVVVVACGYQTPELLPRLTATLQPIRGQVEWGATPVRAELVDVLLTYPINGMGHFIRTPDAWVAGATFQREETNVQPRAKDVDKNFEKLAVLVPELAKPELERLREQSASWVGIRTAQKSRQPLVERIAISTHPNGWVCTGLGARGVSLAALCAEQLLAATQTCDPAPLGVLPKTL